MVSILKILLKNIKQMLFLTLMTFSKPNPKIIFPNPSLSAPILFFLLKLKKFSFKNLYLELPIKVFFKFLF